MSDYRRSLYKERKEVLSPQQHNRINRKLQEANRNKNRRDQFQLSRQISISPTPQHKKYDAEKENKEIEETNNVVVQKEEEEIHRKKAKVVPTARDPAKIKKQEAFILRFLDWRDKKKAMQEKKKSEALKKKPFVSAVSKDTGFGSSTNSLTVATTSAVGTSHASFIPKGHHQGFQPPEGLKNPMDIVKEKVKSRQSIYTVVPTPPKKKSNCLDENTSKKINVARKVLPTTTCFPTKVVKPVANKTPSRPEPTTGNNPSGTKHKVVPSTSSSTKSSTKVPKNLVTNLQSKPETNSASKNPKPQIVKPILPQTRAYKMPPPSQGVVKKSTASASAAAAAKKADVPQIKITKPKYPLSAKRTTEKVVKKRLSKSPQKTQKNARLAQPMKAKKPVKPPSGSSTKLLNLMVTQTNGLVADMIIQTPKDFTNAIHFDDFVTSTKLKNSSQTLEVDGVSPIETLAKRSSHSASAKRNLLKETTDITKNPCGTSDFNKPLPTSLIGKKYNFIRYSDVNVSIEDCVDKADDIEYKAKANSDGSPNRVNNDRTLTAEKVADEERTPTKQPNVEDDKPINYLSPFVSVSRGKVSLKKEKEKRNSIYLATTGEDGVQPLEETKITIAEQLTSPQYSAEVRRTVEAVRYFRKQLQEEIDRLHQQCDVWEEYKAANLEKLQSANCDDMIDVAIGQTRLLTSKKFMQFKGLIDRCEARATGIGDVPDDGSEKTKNVEAVDLEGFWSMLGIQIDNLEKRFENLNRWKANDWLDPDETKPKEKKPKNLTKVKKAAAAPAKAKPNSALQQMLRKKQAEMRMKKANNLLVNTDDVILTPSKVRDRKYFSPAATVVSIPSSNRRLSTLQLENITQGSPNRRVSLLARKNSNDSPNRRMSLLTRKNSQDTPNRRNTLMMARKTSQDSPKLTKSILEFREALDNVLNDRATEHQSNGKMQNNDETFNSPVVKTRKSILKTPGTGRTILKNVVFNEKLRVKKFKFIINNDDDNNDIDQESNASNEEDLKRNEQGSNEESDTEAGPEKLGIYRLRNRKVRLRPSSEIVIPK
ncbi:guanylate kinase-associated family member mars [Haematobia irritans]|uniref:guanylate kinase-associated family member mars n=1 Tax=Haematobia irritans TaxID=7368 RepID=UPI003F4F719B